MNITLWLLSCFEQFSNKVADDLCDKYMVDALTFNLYMYVMLVFCWIKREALGPHAAMDGKIAASHVF